MIRGVDRVLLEATKDDQLVRLRGLPPFMAAKFQSWYLSLMLGMPPCALHAAAAGKHGLDQRIMDLAMGVDVPVKSLEPFAIIFKLFNNGMLQEQVEMLKIEMLSVEDAEDATATLIAQYLEQKHVAALKTSRVMTRPGINLTPEAFDAMFDELRS